MPGIDDIAGFARDEVFATLSERYQAKTFSRPLWRRMGELGMLGITVEERYGGSGGGAADLAEAVRLLAMHGCDLGLALSLITHLALCAKSIELYGSEAQRERYLPLLTSGEWVGAAAVSEAGTGAHPGGIQTTATPVSDGYLLNGKKLYTTDGPVADLLLVIAATRENSPEGKELTAFLVETSRPGFEARRMDLNFLLTAPHGELTFTDVLLPRDSVLGAEGEGHSLASRTAFARERALVLSAMCGLFATAVNEVADRYRQMQEGLDLEGREAGSWIHHLSAVEAYRLISHELVEAAFEGGERWRASLDLLIYMGMSYGKWVFWLEDFVMRHELEVSFPLDVMLNDVKLALVNEGLLMKLGKQRFLR